MVCEAWNRGITRDDSRDVITDSRDDSRDVTTDSRDVITDSRDLCSLSLKVAQLLPSYKDVYTKHMTLFLEKEKTLGS